MELVYVTGSDLPPGARVFRTSRASLAFFLAVGAAGLAGDSFWFGRWPDHSAGVQFLGSAAAVVFAAWTVLGLMRLLPALRRSNWVLRIEGGRCLVQFRSYLKWRVGSDRPNAISLTFEEIESARATREVLSAPSADRGSGMAAGDTQVWRVVYLELRLASPAPAEVEHALGAEFFRQSGGRKAGGVWWKARPAHFFDPRTVRLRWDGVAPSIETALAELSRHVEVAPGQTVKMPAWDVAQGPQLDELVRRLVLAEVMLGAKYLAQRRLGLNPKEAAAHVDRLCAEVA